MKSLQESLFDKDLAEKGVPIDFEALRDMLFDFGRRKASMFDKAGVVYHEGKQSIFIKRFVGVNEEVCFELEIGVTNMYEQGKSVQAGFMIPTLRVHDRIMSLSSGVWNSSRSDLNAVSRMMIKKIPGLEDYRKYTACAEFVADDSNVGELFKLYDGMIKLFCSKNFSTTLEDYVKKCEHKHTIPGMIMDILMKELINKA